MVNIGSSRTQYFNHQRKLSYVQRETKYKQTCNRWRSYNEVYTMERNGSGSRLDSDWFGVFLVYLVETVNSEGVIYSSICSQQDITIDLNPLTGDAIRLNGTASWKLWHSLELSTSSIYRHPCLQTVRLHLLFSILYSSCGIRTRHTIPCKADGAWVSKCRWLNRGIADLIAITQASCNVPSYTVRASITHNMVWSDHYSWKWSTISARAEPNTSITNASSRTSNAKQNTNRLATDGDRTTRCV